MRIETIVALALTATCVVAVPARAQDVAPGTTSVEPATDYLGAWDKLKTLSGTWTSHIVGNDDEQTIISYHVTGGDRVVFEEFLGDTPDGVRDMATAYHLDVDGLVATHYCGAGNQPRMRGASWDPRNNVLRFDFWDITNLADPAAYYTTNIELEFKDADNVELRFRGRTDGVQQDDWQVHRLRRLTTRAHDGGDGVR